MKGQLPAGMSLIQWPAEISPVFKLTSQINKAARAPMQGPEGTCLYEFRAQGRLFLVVQNMWPVPRRAAISVDRKASGLTRQAAAVDLNTSARVPAAITADQVTLEVPLGPWDASLVECRGSSG